VSLNRNALISRTRWSKKRRKSFGQTSWTAWLRR